MNTKKTLFLYSNPAAFIFCSILLLQTGAQAQENDWPCEQVLVTEVSAAVLWPYPLDEATTKRWKSNTKVTPLASSIANQYTAGDEEVARIDQFLLDVGVTERPNTATDLFLATLNAFNLKRKQYLRGIQKFTAKQKNLASRLSRLLEKRDTLAGGDASLAALDDEIGVVEQIFRNRENILMDLCEHPVRLEENLGRVARTIAQHVE